MRALSDEEVFGTTKSPEVVFSDDEVFGSAKPVVPDVLSRLFQGVSADPMGTGAAEIMAAAAPAPASVLENLPPDSSAFNFKAASAMRRKLDANVAPTARRTYSEASASTPVDSGFIENAARIARKVLGGANSGTAGLVRAVGDVTGLESVTDFARTSGRAGRRFANQTQAGKTSIEGFTPGSIVQSVPGALEEAAVSIGTQIPALATGSVPAALAVMFSQSAGTQYGEIRDKGLDILPALVNAALTGGAEVVGEKFGGTPGTIRALRGAIAGNTPARVSAEMVRAGVRDIPGEQLTTALQYGTDAAPVIGSNPAPTLREYLDQAKNTAVQTVLQGGMMTGAGSALASAARLAGNSPANGQALPAVNSDFAAKEMAREIDATAQSIADKPTSMLPTQKARVMDMRPMSDPEVFGEKSKQSSEVQSAQSSPAIENVAAANFNEAPAEPLTARAAPVTPDQSPAPNSAPAPVPTRNEVQTAPSGPLLQADRPESITSPPNEAPNVQNPAPAPEAPTQPSQAIAAQASAAQGVIAAGPPATGTPARTGAVQADGVSVFNVDDVSTSDSFNSLPGYAQQAIGEHHMEQVTNRKIHPGLINAEWEKVTVPVESLRKKNALHFELKTQQKYAARKIYNSGPSIVDRDGELVDGNHRFNKAVRDGQATIEIYQPKTRVAVQADGVAELTPISAGPVLADPDNSKMIADRSLLPANLGRDNVPLADGGKPFKTKLQADTAKKQQPVMRVIRVDGGFALVEKTQKQLDAQERAARRLRNAQTSPAGQAIPAHAMIAAAGGMHPSTRGDMGMDGNVRIGNRTLFAGKTGNGLTLERATEKLIEDGYLPENASHSDAIALIKRSLSNPQYTPEGVERMAEKEAQAAADANDVEQEAIAKAQEAEDNQFADAADAYELAMLNQPAGVTQSDMSREDAFLAMGFTEQEYQDAIAEKPSRSQSSSELGAGALEAAAGASPQSDSGRESTPSSIQGQDAGLSAPSRQDVLAQQERKGNAAALDQREQINKEASQQKLEQSVAPEQRKDTSGDMFAMEKATAEIDARNAGQAAKVDPNQSGMFDEPAPAEAATQILDAADIKGKDRLEALRDVRAGLITPEELKAAYPAAEKIKDFGEKIGGAKKDIYTSFKSELNAVNDEDIAAQPLAKIWPAPDYQKLIDSGIDSEIVAMVRAFRDEIPSKPRQSYKVARWAEQVKGLREFANKVMDGQMTVEKVIAKASDGTDGMRRLFGRIELYQAVGHEKSLQGIGMAWQHYSLYKGKENVSLWVVQRDAVASAFSNWPQELATGATKEQAIAAFKEKYEALDAINAVRHASFDIISYKDKTGYFIAKKIGRNHADLEGPFKTVTEARAYRTENLDALNAKLAKYKEIPRERRDTNEPRVGEDMRNGQDVSPEMFTESFGFKGVEFGNWVEQKRRQKDLNDAFDALMDMAAVLGIPSRAISLNGALGLAFGARGSGGVNPAAAHYESDKVVINLTKKEGAGSLGHEWWHALDNYFGKQRQGGDFMTLASDVSLSARGSNYLSPTGVRKEMVEAFGAVVKSIKQTAMKARSAKLDSKRGKEYWGTGEELAARAFESYLIAKLQDQNASNDYLANVVDERSWTAMAALGIENNDSYPYPTADEIPAIRAGFDHFFDTVKTTETDKGFALFSRPDDAGASTAANVRTVLTNRFGTMIARMEKRGFLKIWDSTAQFNASGQSSRQIEGMAQGMWDGKNAHLFADGIAEGQEVAVMLHEVGEHASMQKMLGNQTYNRLVRRAHELMFADDPTALAAVSRIPEDTPERFRDSELLAYMIETVAAADAKASPSARKWLADIVAAIRAWWSTTGLATKLLDFGIRMELTPKDIAALAVRAVNWQGAQGVQAVDIQLSRPPPAASSWTAPPGSPPVNPNTGAVTPQPWSVAEPGTMDNFVRAIQNNKIDLKRVRDAIAENAAIPQQADAYLNEELYHGKVSARVTALHEQQVEPILKKIAVAGKNVGITLDDVNQYLHAQHAPERNAAMQAINPGMANNTALSGMSDAEAATILADFKAGGKDAGLALISTDIYQLLSDTRTGMVADGLEDAATVHAWEQAYKHYAPLQRDIKSSGTPKGQGISVRGPEAKRAMGSNAEVVNILANIVAQAETAAIRAEKAIVGRSLLDMARQNPNPKFWKVDAAPTKARIDKETGLVIRNAIDPMFQTADNVVMVKDYGIEHFIVFEKNSERAMAVAKAMKNLDIAPMNKILEVASKGTRFIASLLTQRNPLFWMTNFARDIQGALINLEGTQAEGLQSRILANLGKSFKGMHAVVRGQSGGQWARYAKEMQEAGGTTGYMQQFENSDARMEDLQKEVDRMSQGQADPRRLGRLMLDFVDDYNDIIENAVRLSVFQTAREAGASTSAAASIAKNITVNFNRKGNLTPPINALYMFFNASVQGTARLAQALTTSRSAQVVVGGIAVMGFLLDALNRAMSDDDEETGRNRYDMIPEFEKSKNWIFMNPMKPGQYVKVPLPLGPHVFHNAGRLISDAVFRDDPRNASEYGWSMASTVLDAFSPLGVTPSVGQLIAPSILDPVLQVAENKSFTGGPVYKSGDTGFGKTDPKPAYTRHFENTPDVWKAASRGLNDITGGDKDKPGMVNLEPDILKHVFYAMTGGPGRMLDQASDTTQSQARGEAPSVNRIPFVSRFYGENDDRQRQRVYYDDRKRAADAKTQHDHFAKIGRADLAREVAEDLGDGDPAKGRRMMHEFNSAQSSVSKINKQIRAELQRQDTGEDRAKELTDLKKRRVTVMGGVGRAQDDE